jgi:hypothetical protein
MENNETFVLELKKYYIDNEEISNAINLSNEAQEDLFELFENFSNEYEESKDDSLFDGFTNDVKKHIQKYKSVSEFANSEGKKINDNLNKLNDISDKNEDVIKLIEVLEDLGNTLESYSKLLNLSIKTIKEVGGNENE